MNQADYTDTGWLIVHSDGGHGITKVFKYDSLLEILSFSKRAMQVIEQEKALDLTMFKLNGFECIISILSKPQVEKDGRELRIADAIDKVYKV